MIGEISLEMRFDAGHRIVGHKGKCARLHGHTYKVHILCQGEVKEPGFVVDFGDLKDLVNEWDHRMLLWDQDTLPLRGYDDIIWLPFNPTAENMVEYLCMEIAKRFNLDRVFVELWETPNAMARYGIPAEFYVI
jgi:6-pyruvoyltetrahydropterin/6-carboxytetrahydropterin synthase